MDIYLSHAQQSLKYFQRASSLEHCHQAQRATLQGDTMLLSSRTKTSQPEIVRGSRLTQAAFLLISSLLLWSTGARADTVTDWNATGVTVVVTNAQRPPAASYIDLAYMH